MIEKAPEQRQVLINIKMIKITSLALQSLTGAVHVSVGVVSESTAVVLVRLPLPALWDPLPLV